MEDLKFEDISVRHNAAMIKMDRLEYKGLFLYYIRVYGGCFCCDSWLIGKKLKVRKNTGSYFDNEVVKSKTGKSFINLPYSTEITEEKLIEIYKENY